MTRQGSRSSPNWEKCFKSSASRARGISSSMVRSITGIMRASTPNQSAEGIMTPPSTQKAPKMPVNLTSEPWKRDQYPLTNENI